MKEILLSVVIPVYNVEKYIKSCIDSIFNQGLQDEEFEVVLVNDGCTDNTINIVNKLINSHPNIFLIHQTNQGPSAARNKGLKNARGKYILFVDSDDLLICNSIKPMLQLAIEKDLDILKSNAILVDNKDVLKNKIPSNVRWENWNDDIVDGVVGFISQFDPRKPWLIVNLIKKDFLLVNNLYLTNDVSVGEDLLMSVRIYLKAKRFMSIPYTHYIYRRNESSIMSTIYADRLIDLNKVIKYLYDLNEKTELCSEGRNKLIETIYTCFTINIWYLSHYTSLYPQRKEVIADLKKKCPNLSFNRNMKQRMTTFFYKYMPSLYISIRYFTAKRKYNQ